MSALPGPTLNDPPLEDWPVMDRWLDDQGLPPGPSEAVELMTGGTQNLLVRFRRGDTDYVLRRPPLHPRPASNAALRREIDVLRGLQGTVVPHPTLVAACDDESITGSVFYVMSLVEGFNATTDLPAEYLTDSGRCHGLVLDAIDALVLVGSVDHERSGLSHLGRPEGFLERQVPRWLRELESYQGLSGYGGTSFPGLDGVTGWLHANRPAKMRPGIMHGDFHLGNLLFSACAGNVSAIVDWEMCTIGDPLLDLGRFLATWPAPDEPMGTVGQIYRSEGLPTRAEIVHRYAEGSDRDLAAIDWYVVLACFKLGIILEGTYARACAGQADRAVGTRLHQMSRALFTRAEGIIQ